MAERKEPRLPVTGAGLGDGDVDSSDGEGDRPLTRRDGERMCLLDDLCAGRSSSRKKRRHSHELRFGCSGTSSSAPAAALCTSANLCVSLCRFLSC